MSETKTDNDKTLSVTSAKTLSLKRPAEQGTVRQSFSHGRSKTVVVEKKTQRKFVRPEAETPPEGTPAETAPAPAPAEAAAAAPASSAPAEPAATPPRSEQAAARPQPAQKPARAASEARAPDARPPRGSGEPGKNRVPPRPDARNTPRPDGRGGRSDRQGGGQRSGGGVVLRTLTDEERDARGRALADARVREADERKRAEVEAKRRAEEEVRLARERAEAERRKAEEDARRKAEDEAKRKAEDEAKRRLGESADKRPEGAARPATQARTPREGRPQGQRPAGVGPRPPAARPAGEEAAATTTTATPTRTPTKRPPARPAPTPPPAAKRKGDDRSRGRLTMGNALLADEERARSVAAFRRRVQRLHRGQPTETRDKIAREVILPETITIQELANRMAERGVDVIRLLMAQGGMYKITDVIDADTAELVATDLGHKVKRVSEADVEEGLFAVEAETDGLVSRPPVVTIMGHVDHGKTSLLDAIRQSNVVSGEAGGITQHIGAYQVESPNGGKITFIDTPGHAAFTAMRARGARVTDIVILVVAADDGVMPQTIEAINHAKAANVPMIVAINKIDKPDANPQKVRTELLQYEVQVESMGGETQELEVSALKRINLDGLLDAITLQAEVLELKANPERDAEGFVIEAKLDKGRGPVATTLVQRGTLKVGDILVAGSEWGRVRAMLDDKGTALGTAGPSVPVEVLGFNGTPEAGDRFAVVENEARAREIADYRERQKREKLQARGAARGSLEKMMDSLKAEGQKVFPLLIKGDVQGSVEAIIGALDKLGTSEVTARVLHSGVGGVTESDVTLASASGAAIIAFNVRANNQARTAAERDGIEIRYYNIIYNLVDDVKAAMSGLLAPMLRETMLGNAQILEVFNITKVGKVAGCRVTDGTVQRGAKVRLIRDSVVIHEGELSQLKRFKDDAKEVVAGQECGMAFANYQDMRAGDVIECYRVEEIIRTL